MGPVRSARKTLHSATCHTVERENHVGGRLAALGLLSGLQLGFMLCLEVGHFPHAALACHAALLPPLLWDFLPSWLELAPPPPVLTAPKALENSVEVMDRAAGLEKVMDMVCRVMGMMGRVVGGLGPALLLGFVLLDLPTQHARLDSPLAMLAPGRFTLAEPLLAPLRPAFDNAAVVLLLHPESWASFRTVLWGKNARRWAMFSRPASYPAFRVTLAATPHGKSQLTQASTVHSTM